MGLEIDYFYSLTPRQFYNIQNGWATLRDADSKERILLTRRLMYAALSPYLKNGTEQSIWPLDFIDKPKDLEPVSIEAIEAVEARWKASDTKTYTTPKALKLNDLIKTIKKAS